MRKFEHMNDDEIPIEHKPKMFTLKSTAHLDYNEIAETLDTTHVVSNVNIPSPSHAATRMSVDSVSSGLNVISAVKLATTRDIICAGISFDIDGVMVSHRDRVLVKNQDDPTTNGVYIVNGFGDWWWASDYNSSGSILGGCFTFVEQGESQANTGWVLMTNVFTGRSPALWVQFTGRSPALWVQFTG